MLPLLQEVALAKRNRTYAESGIIKPGCQSITLRWVWVDGRGRGGYGGRGRQQSREAETAGDGW